MAVAPEYAKNGYSDSVRKYLAHEGSRTFPRHDTSQNKTPMTRQSSAFAHQFSFIREDSHRRFGRIRDIR